MDAGRRCAHSQAIRWKCQCPAVGIAWTLYTNRRAFG